MFENTLSRNVVVLRFAGLQTPPWAQAEGGTESCLKLGTSNFHALSLVLCSTMCLFWWCYQFWDTFIYHGVSPVECHPLAEYVHFGVTATLYWVDSSFLCHPHLGSTILWDEMFSMNYVLKRPASGLYPFIVIASIYFDSSWWLPWYPTAQFCFGLETTLCHQCFVYFWSGIQRHLSGS